VRPRTPTISTLGRTPSRTGKGPAATAPAGSPPPLDEPPGEPGAIRRFLRGALVDNLGLKFLSMVLAITVFLLVNTDRHREITARVGVTYVLPDEKVLVSERLEEARVTIKGPWQRLRRFDERELDRITLDLRRASSGDIQLTPDMVGLPTGLEVTSISPRSVRVLFDRRVEKVVEVTPQLAGRPQHGYLVAESKPTPATIRVRGAEGTIVALSAVRTREISVDGRTETFTAQTEALPPNGVEVAGSAQLLVLVVIDEELVTRKVPGLPVAVRGDSVDPARWQVTPAEVEVTLTGTLLSVEKARATVVPVVTIASGETRAREATVTLEGLDPGIGVRISPERVKISPVKPTPPAPPAPAPER
jgi:YbbR domain-containing protein